jgi:hypothetical protein
MEILLFLMLLNVVLVGIIAGIIFLENSRPFSSRSARRPEVGVGESNSEPAEVAVMSSQQGWVPSTNTSSRRPGILSRIGKWLAGSNGLAGRLIGWTGLGLIVFVVLYSELVGAAWLAALFAWAVLRKARSPVWRGLSRMGLYLAVGISPQVIFLLLYN